MDASQIIEVLMVEDNPADAELALRSLKQFKVINQIHWLKDGAEALNFLFCREEFADRVNMPRPRVVLLDLKLPKVDGMEVLRQVKADARTKAIPVVILTSSKEERDLVESYNLCANSYIVKPVDFAQFAESMRQLGVYWLLLNQTPSV